MISNSPRSATRYFALSERNLFRCNDSDDLVERIDYWLEHPPGQGPAAAPTRAMPVNLTLTAAWTPWKGCFWTRYRVHVGLNGSFIIRTLCRMISQTTTSTKAVDRHFPFLHRSRLWALWSFWCIMALQFP